MTWLTEELVQKAVAHQSRKTKCRHHQVPVIQVEKGREEKNVVPLHGQWGPPHHSSAQLNTDNLASFKQSTTWGVTVDNLASTRAKAACRTGQ